MKKRTIGMVVPTVDNSFFSGLAAQVDRVMSENGCHTFIVSSANDAKKELSLLKELAAGADGIICVSGLSELPEGILPEKFPLVWADRVPKSAWTIPWVANDDADAMEKATNLLMKKNCRNILLLPGFLAEHQESPRVRGYRNALEQNGIDFHNEYVLYRQGKRTTEEETGDLIRMAVANHIPVDGVITSSDRAAFGAMTALRSVGYFVPEDVRLISFDHSPYATMASPPITALDRKPEALAKKACEILKKMMDGTQDFQTENVIPVSLVKRDTTR